MSINHVNLKTSEQSRFPVRNTARILLAASMIFAGISHLTFARVEFQAQVPDWVPISKDAVVVLSGIVEIAFGLALIFWTRHRATIGITLAVFFVLVFPGNIAQYLDQEDAFGLNTDRARFIRLFFQPVLIAWALWSTRALGHNNEVQ